jgi:hypothetical protein
MPDRPDQLNPLFRLVPPLPLPPLPCHEKSWRISLNEVFIFSPFVSHVGLGHALLYGFPQKEENTEDWPATSFHARNAAQYLRSFHIHPEHPV